MNTSIVGSAGFVVLVATIVVLIAARRDADPERLRTVTRYVDAVSLLSVFVLLYGVFAAVAQLSRFIINENHRFGGPSILDRARGSFSSSTQAFASHSNDAIWRSFVQAVLVAIAAGLVLAFHARERRRITTTTGFDSTAGGRVDLAFRYATCFVAVFIVLLSISFGTYALFRIAAPGVASSLGGSTERERGIAQALSLLVLLCGAGAIFRAYWRPSMRPTVPTPAPGPTSAIA